MNDKLIAIVAPCFNEGSVIIEFLKELEVVLGDLSYKFMVVIVDDRSLDNTLDLLKKFKFGKEKFELKVLQLHRNKGHQGAINCGLRYVSRIESVTNVIVMDSDGEDDPNAIRELVELTSHDIVFVTRGRRKESVLFKTFYTIYKLLFLVITGQKVNFGNFSMISKRVVNEIGQSQFIHYSAFLSKLGYPLKRIKYNRRERIDGHSKMNLDSLILHGFKSFIEYAEKLFFIFLKLFLFVMFLIVIGAIALVYSKYVLKSAVLGWTSSLMMSLVIIAIICMGFFVLGIMMLYSVKRLEMSNEGDFRNEYDIIE